MKNLIIDNNKECVNWNIDYLNLGNNYTFEHMIKAIKEQNLNEEINYLWNFPPANYELNITAKLNFNFMLKDTFIIDEFLDYFNH